MTRFFFFCPERPTKNKIKVASMAAVPHCVTLCWKPFDSSPGWLHDLNGTQTSDLWAFIENSLQKKHRKASTLSQSQFPKILSSVKFVKKNQWLVFYFPKVAGRSMPHKHCWWIFQFQCGKSKPPSFNQSFWWTKQHCQSNLNVFLLTTCQFLI